MLFTAAARVIVCVATHPTASLEEIAAGSGIDRRHVQRLLPLLEQAGYLSYTRANERNRYDVHLDAPLGPRLSGRVSDLLALLTPADP